MDLSQSALFLDSRLLHSSVGLCLESLDDDKLTCASGSNRYSTFLAHCRRLKLQKSSLMLRPLSALFI